MDEGEEITKEQNAMMDYAVYVIGAIIEDKGVLTFTEWLIYTNTEI